MVEIIFAVFVAAAAVVLIPIGLTTTVANNASGDPAGQSARDAPHPSIQQTNRENVAIRRTQPPQPQALEFVSQNLDEVLIDMAAGGGEYLTSLALLEGCRATSHPRLAGVLRQNYYRLRAETKPTPEAVVQFVEYNIRTNTQLRVDCSGTPIKGGDAESNESTAGNATGNSADSTSFTGDSVNPAGTAAPAASDAAAPPDFVEDAPVETIGSAPLANDIVDTPEAAQPAKVATTLPELAGSYEARVVRQSPDYWCFNGHRRFRIELAQQDEKIRGIFASGISGGIDGRIDGDRVYFNWYTAHCPGGTDGEWRIEGDSSLRGSGELGFEWTLIRDR